MFEDVLFEPEQENLLATLVEAARNVLRDQRREFMCLRGFTGHGSLLVKHPGLPGGTLEANTGDIEVLAHEGLIVLRRTARGTPGNFDVAARGFKYYEQMKQRGGQPVQRIETEIRNYLNADHFRQKYSKAYGKWAEAEEKLSDSESESQFTQIGHLCREAVQEFATALVDQYQPPNVNQDKACTVDRLRAVLGLLRDQLGRTVERFLDALVAYWGEVNDLIQRQEHGAQREGQPLVWEDGRRVVFQAAVVMFEIDRALSLTIRG